MSAPSLLGYPLPLAGDDAATLVRDSLLLDGRPAPTVRAVPGGRLFLRAGMDVGTPLPCVACIGAFDGVHRGHRELLSHACREADELGLACVAVAFDPDPAELLAGPRPSSRLLEPMDRVRGLLLVGADAVLLLDFTPRLAATPYDAFLSAALEGPLRPVSMHVGSNFRFGRGAKGGPAELAAVAAPLGMRAHCHELARSGGEHISATRVRGLVRGGRVEDAAGLLGRLHFVSGVVVHGRGEGTAFGFPTANVSFPLEACAPDQGVYAGFVSARGRSWPAAINVGAPPSFSEADRPFLEANLLGFSGDLYGRRVHVSFGRWLRDSRPFDSFEELERVVMDNIAWVRANFGDRAVTLGGAADLEGVGA